MKLIVYVHYGNPIFQIENQYEFTEDRQAKDQENSNFDLVTNTGKQLNSILYCQIGHLSAKACPF